MISVALEEGFIVRYLSVIKIKNRQSCLPVL